MKILVTGATGFVGKKIVAELVETGAQIITCGRNRSADLPNYYQVDITSKPSIERLFNEIGRIDCVVHSAGLAHQFQAPKDPGVFYSVNVDGTGHIAEAAANTVCKKFILISSISVYGDGKPNPCTEDFPCAPSGDYAESKLGAEVVATAICRKAGIDLTVLRLATVYGEGDVGNVLRLLKMIDGGKFVWAGKGKNSKSLIYNGDAARACHIAIKEQQPGINIYNVTDQPHSMKKIVNTIAEKLELKAPKLSLPAGLVNAAFKTMSIVPIVGRKAKNLSQTLKKWQSDDVLSGEKIKRDLGFVTETSLAEGIAREVAWYRNGR
jgi:UDP-glucose 4-epimerase